MIGLILLISIPVLPPCVWLLWRWRQRRPFALPLGWEWRVLNENQGGGAGAELFDQVADVRRGWVRRWSTDRWRTSRGEVDGDIIDAMRHVERELAALGWRV